MLAYITTKSAVIAMTRQIALDYARFGVRVNALCPGWIDTPFNAPYTAQLGGRAALEHVVSTAVPMGRFGRVDEIAEAILFLVSDRSSFMTGHALVIDGGESFCGRRQPGRVGDERDARPIAFRRQIRGAARPVPG